jgi:hypothetical protein
VPQSDVYKNNANAVWYWYPSGGISHNSIEQEPTPWSGVEVYGGEVQINRNTIHGAKQTYGNPCNPYGSVYISGPPPSQAQILDNEIALADASHDCSAVFCLQWSERDDPQQPIGRETGTLGDLSLVCRWLDHTGQQHPRVGCVPHGLARPRLQQRSRCRESASSVIDEGTDNAFQSVGSFGCPAPAAASSLDFRLYADLQGVKEGKNLERGSSAISRW